MGHMFTLGWICNKWLGSDVHQEHCIICPKVKDNENFHVFKFDKLLKHTNRRNTKAINVESK